MKKLSIIVVMMMIGAVLFVGASCSASTANISNAVMTSAVDENSEPLDEVTEFPLNVDVYVAAELHNAPDDTTVTFVWYQGNTVFDTVSIGNEGYSDTPLVGYLPAGMITEPGDYSVEIYIDDRDEPDTVSYFTVVSNNSAVSTNTSTAQITNAVTTTGIDENYLPVDHVTQFPVNTTVYVSAELHNAPEDTNITFVWYYEDQIADSITINNQGYSDVPVYTYLPAEYVLVAGNYSVEIYIDDRTAPESVSTFTVV
jgi:hypothetical protein